MALITILIAFLLESILGAKPPSSPTEVANPFSFKIDLRQ